MICGLGPSNPNLGLHVHSARDLTTSSKLKRVERREQVKAVGGDSPDTNNTSYDLRQRSQPYLLSILTADLLPDGQEDDDEARAEK